MTWLMTPELARGIAATRRRLGDGPYVLVEQARSLDIDGYTDSIALVASFPDLALARDALSRHFAHMVDTMPDNHEWHDDAHHALPIELDTTVANIKLVEQRGRKRKDPNGFCAETVAVQLLEIATPPIIGEPLFRALRYDFELARYLSKA